MTSHDAAARALVENCQVPAYPGDDEYALEAKWTEELIVRVAAALREAEARGLEEAANHKEECHFAGRLDDTIDWCRAQAQVRREDRG